MRDRMARTVLATATVGLIAFAVAAGTAGVGNAEMSLGTSAWSSHLTADQVRVLSPNADPRVIVMLRDQHTAVSGRQARQAHAFATDRAPIVAQLRQLHVPRLVAYHTVNAIATTVSATEAANLRRDPAVLAVYPDVLVKGPSPHRNLLRSDTRAVPRSTAASSSKAALCGPASFGGARPPPRH